MNCVHLSLPRKARQSSVKKCFLDAKETAPPKCIVLTLEIFALLAERNPYLSFQKCPKSSTKSTLGSPPQTQKNPERVCLVPTLQNHP